jgi:hypothetical protein
VYCVPLEFNKAAYVCHALAEDAECSGKFTLAAPDGVITTAVSCSLGFFWGTVVEALLDSLVILGSDKLGVAGTTDELRSPPMLFLLPPPLFQLLILS